MGGEEVLLSREMRLTMNDNRKQLDQMLKSKVSQKEAFNFFDQLEPVKSADMIGGWKGEELITGHPM